MHPTSTRTAPDRAGVLTKAVIRASDLLDLNDAELAQVIGVSAPTVDSDCLTAQDDRVDGCDVTRASIDRSHAVNQPVTALMTLQWQRPARSAG